MRKEKGWHIRCDSSQNKMTNECFQSLWDLTRLIFLQKIVFVTNRYQTLSYWELEGIWQLIHYGLGPYESAYTWTSLKSKIRLFRSCCQHITFRSSSEDPIITIYKSSLVKLTTIHCHELYLSQSWHGWLIYVDQQLLFTRSWGIHTIDIPRWRTHKVQLGHELRMKSI